MKLDNKIKIINGYPFDSKDFNLDKIGYPVIKIKELKQGSVQITKDTSYANYNEQLAPFLIRNGDFLVALTGNPPNKGGFDAIVGRCCKYKLDNAALLNQRVCKVLSDSPDLDNEYLYYFLSLESTTKNLATRCTGSANQANISSKDIKDLHVDLPPIEIQHHIVNTTSSLLLKSL